MNAFRSLQPLTTAGSKIIDSYHFQITDYPIAGKDASAGFYQKNGTNILMPLAGDIFKSGSIHGVYTAIAARNLIRSVNTTPLAQFFKIICAEFKAICLLG